MIKKLDHACISASDIDRSVAFYRDILGMKVAFKDETSGKDFGTVMGATGNFYCRVVQFEEGLEVSQFISPVGKKISSSPWDPGTILLDFQVSDLDKMYAELTGKGVKFVSPPVTLKAPPPGEGGLKIAQFYGPDGERIALIELAKG